MKCEVSELRINLYTYIHIFTDMFFCILILVVKLCFDKENEYPLVERFMYLFMVVLQGCIFFPKTHFGSRGYSLMLLSF